MRFDDLVDGVGHLHGQLRHQPKLIADLNAVPDGSQETHHRPEGRIAVQTTSASWDVLPTKPIRVFPVQRVTRKHSHVCVRLEAMPAVWPVFEMTMPQRVALNVQTAAVKACAAVDSVSASRATKSTPTRDNVKT